MLGMNRMVGMVQYVSPIMHPLSILAEKFRNKEDGTMTRCYLAFHGNDYTSLHLERNV